MCNCIQTVNDELAKLKANTEIFVPLTLSKITRVCIETQKIDDKKRGKTMRVFASFCPFCGQDYSPETEDNLPEVDDKNKGDELSTLRNNLIGLEAQVKKLTADLEDARLDAEYRDD